MLRKVGVGAQMQAVDGKRRLYHPPGAGLPPAGGAGRGPVPNYPKFGVLMPDVEVLMLEVEVLMFEVEVLMLDLGVRDPDCRVIISRPLAGPRRLAGSFSRLGAGW